MFIYYFVIILTSIFKIYKILIKLSLKYEYIFIFRLSRKEYFQELLQPQNLLLMVIINHIVIGPTTIYVNSSTTVSVSVLDSSLNPVSLLTTQLLFIQITNESTKGANFNLTPATGQQIVLDQDIFEQMTLGTDGTYQYSFTLTKVGKITIWVLLYTQGGAFVEYFANMFYEGDNIDNRTEAISNFYFDWGTSAISPTGRADFLSKRYNFLLKSPATGTINFKITVDDFVNLYISKKRNITLENHIKLIIIRLNLICATFNVTFLYSRKQTISGDQFTLLRHDRIWIPLYSLFFYILQAL